MTSSGPYDLGSKNTDFSIYNEYSDFRVPEEMKNHTRHSHNEMVKERLIVDKDGNVVKNKPNYVIWIEEDTKSEREKPRWKEKRENDKNWIRTKKAAAQIGVPIVVIDREYFAGRETEKIDLMKKLITGEEIDKEKYKEYLEQYGSLSKAELIEQLIIKFENNRTSLQFNEKLNQTYFTQEQLETIIQETYLAIEQMSPIEKKDCLNSFKSVLFKEFTENKNYYEKLYKNISKKIENLNVQKQESSIYESIGIKEFSTNDNLLKLYFGRQITYTDTDETRRMIVNEQRENSKKEERNKNI